MKSELRKQVLQEMKALPLEQKQFIDQALTERLLQHPFYQEAKVIATYLSFPHEFQTQRLIHCLPRKVGWLNEIFKLDRIAAFLQQIHWKSE